MLFRTANGLLHLFYPAWIALRKTSRRTRHRVSPTISPSLFFCSGSPSEHRPDWVEAALRPCFPDPGGFITGSRILNAPFDRLGDLTRYVQTCWNRC